MTRSDWKAKTLKDLVTINYGKSPKGILSPGGQYPVVGTGGTERFGNDFLHDGNSIVLGRKGTIDRVYFASGRFWTIDTAYYLSDFRNALPRWLYFVLQNLDFRQLNEATGVPSLSRDRLYQIPIHTPPIAEQSKISEILSTIDRAIEQTEVLIAKQHRIKTGLMQDLLTLGIDELGNLRSEETHEFKVSPLGRIPIEWDVHRCTSLCDEIVVGIVVRPTQYYRPQGIPMLRSANVRPNRITGKDLVFMSDQDNEKMKKSQVRTGNVVTVRTGAGVGSTAVIPPEFDGCNAIDIVISRPNPKILRSEYLSTWINSESGCSQVLEGQTGNAQPHFNVGEMSQMLIRVPKIDEQYRIEKVILEQRYLFEQLQLSAEKAKLLKAALMQDLLTGKKRVKPLLQPAEAV